MGRINILIKTCGLGLIISLGALEAKAQQPDRSTLISSFPKEEIVFLTNSRVFLSGETLEYSINCHINNVEKSISDLVYVELVSNTKASIVKQKLRLVDGKAYGDYFIPSSLKTGHYKLLAYTKWTLNNEDAPFYEMDIYIINPFLNAAENNLKNEFDNDEAYLDVAIDTVFAFKDRPETNGLKISTDADSYKKRSKVNLKLERTSNANNFATYTISVKKIDPIIVQPNNITRDVIKKSVTSGHLPEMRGELIQGTVVNTKTNMPAADQAVSLSIPGNQSVYKSVKTNKNGQFYFNLYESFEQEKALIQVVAENRDDFKLTVEPIIFDRYADLNFYPLKLNSNLKTYIVQNSIYNQIESAYYNLKQDSIQSATPAKSFYGKPDLVYVLDDFKRFNSVRETFVEVIQGASIRDRNTGYQFTVQDINDQFNAIYNNIKPLLLFDGIQIQDEALVIDSNIKEIESVSLVSGVYSIGSVMYNGIIDIKLKRQTTVNVSGTYLQHVEITKPLSQKEYFKQNYSNAQSRIPDFRTQLLWQPNLELDSGSEKIEFYTSDVSGDYMIELNGTTNAGKSITLNKTFKVTDE